MTAESHTSDTEAPDDRARARKRRTAITWAAGAAAVLILVVSHRVSGIPHTIPVPFACQPSGQLRAAIEHEMSSLQVPDPAVAITELKRLGTDTRYIQQVTFSADATSGDDAQQPISFSGETRFHRSRCTLLGRIRPETPFASLFAAFIPESDPAESTDSE